MKKFILAEKLKEEINGQQIRAAVFHSFNFDPEFFENYLLPLFLPGINFGDNKIQNTILWRKFQSDLPPITVYCDFHAKSQKGTNLDYLVRAIDVKKKENIKPCYHPKHSFIVLEDWTLIVLTGSNNLTEAGWCSNLEGMNFFKFKNKINFPRELKDNFKHFCRGIREEYYQETFNDENSLSKADNILDQFFRSTGYTGKEEAIYFDTRIKKKAKFKISEFYEFLKYIKNEFNGGIPFRKVEIISPYFSKGLTLFNKLKEVTESENINLSIPFENTDYVALDENLFNSVHEAGFNWKAIKEMNQIKGHRFNHSKIYHILGEEKVFTIVGSVNFTDMAWRGVKEGGNYESAILYQSEAEKWEDMLENYSHDNLSFTGHKEEENHNQDTREDVFDLEFIIDWNSSNPTLSILNKNEEQQHGKIIIENASDILINNSRVINLDNDQLKFFSNTPLIKVRPSNTEIYFYYYPIHKNIENKPLPDNLNLNDGELLLLWKELEEAKNKEATLRIIDKFIDRITDEAGDILKEELRESKSTLNLMATHLSGIINLNKKVFENPKNKTHGSVIQKMRDYYLFTDNVDTIKGYLRLIKKMSHDGKLNDGFYWLLLNIIDKYFYEKYSEMLNANSEHQETIKGIRKSLKLEIKELGNKMVDGSLTEKHLKWIDKMLEEDAK